MRLSIGRWIIIREGLYRGADGGYLLTDRAFAGADTLATSYALATAIKKIGAYDIILGGRQAIDGDTAQVGPQVAEKLGLPQRLPAAANQGWEAPRRPADWSQDLPAQGKTAQRLSLQRIVYGNRHGAHRVDTILR